MIFQEKFIKTGVGDICYKSFIYSEKSQNIVILHGWGGKSDSWIQVGEILSQTGINIYIPDIPGFGKTKINKVYDLENYAEIIEKFVKTLKLDDIILLGHSNGGRISINLALRKKINIKKLILNNSAGIKQKLSFKQKIITKTTKIIKYILGKLHLNNLFFIQKIRSIFYKFIGGHDYLNAENPFLKKTFLNMIDSDAQNDLQNIETETVIIWGDKDTYTPLSDGIFMKKEIKNSKIIILKNEKHGIHLQNPQKLASVILKNL